MLPKNDKKLLIWFWKLADNSRIYFAVFLLFCKEKKTKHKNNKTNQKKNNKPKQNKTKAYFCSLLVKQYEWCHICTYTTKKYNKLIDCCYLSIYKIYSGRHILNVKHNEPHQSNYAFQEQPLCQKKSIQRLQYSYFPQFHHIVSSQKNPVLITFNRYAKKSFEVLKIAVFCILWYLMWNHNHLFHRILVIIFGLNDKIQ